ncbi:MAG TPA: SCO family protein [Gemmatimonadaceae bacterium]
MDTREHRGVALAALGVIGLVTAAWWALALYPAASAPEWVSRTRLACFGAEPGGLPNAGGWILLAGQPAGMLAMLFAGWGGVLRRDLRWAAGREWGKGLFGVAAVALVWGVAGAVSVVSDVRRGERFVLNDPVPVAQAVTVPALRLVDQLGRDFDLRSLQGRPVLVSFAFAHCETMCPTAIRELLRIRAESGRDDIPIVVVTVDPWRDVPSRLATIAKAWNLSTADRVLSGSVEDVNAVLDAWGIGRRRDEMTGEVFHSLAAVLVNQDGLRGSRVDGGFDGLRTILRSE